MPNKNKLSVALLNYEAGGQSNRVEGDTFTIRYDLGGLRRAFRPVKGQAPGAIIINEAKGWETYGGTVMNLAANILTEELGRPYVPLHGVGARGPGSAPALLYDPQAIRFDYWGDGHPTVHPDKQNLANMHLPGDKAAKFRFVVRHLTPYSGHGRTEELREIRGYSNGPPTMIAGDLNCSPGGPHMPQMDWTRAPEFLVDNKALRQPDGTYGPDTEAVDFLLGEWRPEPSETWQQKLPGWPESYGSRAVRNVGWYALCEVAAAQGMDPRRAFMPTVNRGIDQGGGPDGGQLIDLMIVNEAWRDSLVPDTYTVHVPPGETRADFPSDHRLVTADLWVPS